MHIATTNLNPQLWIRIYNDFAIISGLRQTGIAKKTVHFSEKKLLYMCSVNSFAKRIRFLPPLVFSRIALQTYKEILNKYRKRAITL